MDFPHTLVEKWSMYVEILFLRKQESLSFPASI